MSLFSTFVRENAGLFATATPQEVCSFIHISLRHRYLYYATSKVACSTIKSTLIRLEIGDEALGPTEVHLRDRSPLLTPVQAGSLPRLLADPGVLKFTFVRNPFTRVLSAYLEKMRGDKPHKHLILRQLGRFDGEVTFEEFVDAVAAQPVVQRDHHWKVQWHLLLEGRLRFDVIGSFERFDEDFAAIGRRISPDFPRYVRHERRHAVNAGTALRDHYDARLVEKVRRIYADDFEAFGYDRDLPAEGG